MRSHQAPRRTMLSLCERADSVKVVALRMVVLYESSRALAGCSQAPSRFDAMETGLWLF
jgi:hypothetical protein